MAFKPNYKFEKFERERQKAAKKAAKIQAKKEAREGVKSEPAESPASDGDQKPPPGPRAP